jgi:hypothetical protein
MNLHNLEKLARLALKGNNVKNESENMLKAGLLSPVEHRSVTSLSWQIAANVRAGTSEGSTVAFTKPMGAWF